MTYFNANQSLDALFESVDQLVQQTETDPIEDFETLKSFVSQLAQTTIQAILEGCDSSEKLREFTELLEQMTPEGELEINKVREVQSWFNNSTKTVPFRWITPPPTKIGDD